ncbi:hypothetical protein [Sphingomonas abietis]|uniref:DUF2793 domain-containing protein n=1 Tax=Sphingomonas abietis TaxID=3012344 RepID=A0ABY7NKD6_9SPHN|nr:hypothetical protein [Sphingomonas abietis]WBO21986.1 hypothetical protein PBT88_17775 [Sphingomonas abietis]
MIDAVSVPLSIDRGAPRVLRISITGIDLSLSGTSWHAQVRLYPDAAGAPVVDLPQTTDGTVSGVRLAGTDLTGLLPVSFLDVQVAGSVNFPPASEVGDNADLAWDLFVTVPGLPSTKWIAGPVAVVGTVTKEATPAPLVAVPLNGGSDYALQFVAATVSIGMATIDQLSDLVARAKAEADRSEAAVNYGGLRITSMSVSPSQAEAGATVATVTVAYTLTRNPTAQTINGGAVANPVTARSVSYSNIGGTTNFALVVTDSAAPGGAASASQTASITFLNKGHAGTITTSNGAAVTSAAVNGMSQSWFADVVGRTLSFATAADGYIWYSQPASLPDPTAFKLGGFAVTPGIATRSHTTATGQTVLYRDFLLSDLVAAGTNVLLEVIA